MNVYEAMRTLTNYSDWPNHHDDAAIIVFEMLDAYDSLAPSLELWAKYPYAQWYAIDADGEAGLYIEEPHCLEGFAPMWGPLKLLVHNAPIVTLPLGIDWRLCKWSRPEAPQ